MSTTVAVPPPSSASVTTPRRVPRLTERARALLTAVNLHFAGVAALAVLSLYLAVHLLLVVRLQHANNDAAMADQRNKLRAAEIAAQPLRGLDVKLVDSTAQADQFYAQRLPHAYSQMISELGSLSKAKNVRLARVQYAQQPALSGKGELTEVRMDASLTGDYRPLVQFINSLERDKMFFVVNSLAFTGAQGNQVNLRMRLTTYLRQPIGDEPLPGTAGDEDAAASPDATLGAPAAAKSTALGPSAPKAGPR